MAWGVLQPPGSELGPCKDACQHVDCAATREMAAAPCSVCREPIGYDVRFCYTDAPLQPGQKNTERIAHWVCWVEHCEKQRQP